MTKISGSTFYYKTVFPCLWFGVLGLIVLVALLGGQGMVAVLPVLGMAAVMALFGFFLFRRLVGDLADEVFDAADSLLFRKGDREQRVPLDDIVNISYAPLMSPERVTIQVRTPGPLGKELTFAPQHRLWPFSKSPIVAELIERIDEVRRGR